MTRASDWAATIPARQRPRSLAYSAQVVVSTMGSALQKNLFGKFMCCVPPNLKAPRVCYNNVVRKVEHVGTGFLIKNPNGNASIHSKVRKIISAQIF